MPPTARARSLATSPRSRTSRTTRRAAPARPRARRPTSPAWHRSSSSCCRASRSAARRAHSTASRPGVTRPSLPARLPRAATDRQENAMNRLKNLNIGMKLTAAFVALIGLGAALGGFTLLRMSTITDQVDVLTQDALPGITRVSDMTASVADARRHLLGMLLATSLDERTQSQHKLEADVAALEKMLAAVRTSMTRPDLRLQLGEFESAWTAYLRAQDALVRLAADPERLSDALALRDASKPLFDRVREHLVRLTQLDADAGREAGAGIYRAIDSVELWVAVSVALSILFGLAIAVLMTRRLTRPIRELEVAASAMARGDLDVEINYTSDDEIGALADSFRRSSRASAAPTQPPPHGQPGCAVSTILPADRRARSARWSASSSA